MDLTLARTTFADAINDECEDKQYLVLTKHDGYQILWPALDVWDGSVVITEYVMKNDEGIPFVFDEIEEVYELPKVIGE